MTVERRCPGDELLIAYLAAELEAPERDRIERHLADCNACVDTARAIHARLRATAADLTPPPAAVATRARAGLAPPVTAPPRRVPLPLRLPVLIPASLAAGLLLMVAAQTWLLPHAVVLERGADIRRATRATTVWSQPSLRAGAVSRVDAGQMVEVRGQDSGWCRIGLPDRGEGWVECGALE